MCNFDSFIDGDVVTVVAVEWWWWSADLGVLMWLWWLETVLTRVRTCRAACRMLGFRKCKKYLLNLRLRSHGHMNGKGLYLQSLHNMTNWCRK